MKYFVYANKIDIKNPAIIENVLYFVPETGLLEWAELYNPTLMEFVGVCVEARTQDEAKKFFLQPLKYNGLDKILSTDEPNVTAVLKTKHNLGEITMEILIFRLAKLWTHIDDMLRAMADVYALNNKDLTKEQAYQKLKRDWVQKYLEK